MHESFDPLLRANVDNLCAFWSACGYEDLPLATGVTVRRSARWPGRAWFAFGVRPSREDLDQLLALPQLLGAMVPQWPAAQPVVSEALSAAGFRLNLTQEAMATSLDRVVTQPCALDLRRVGRSGAAAWASVASESFGYAVDSEVVEDLVEVDGVHVLLAYDGDSAVASGLLMHTGGVAGLHMLGVPPAHRRRGHARQVMFGLLALARELGCAHITLQASRAGEPLYRQLGFEAQGAIRSYKAPNP